MLARRIIPLVQFLPAAFSLLVAIAGWYYMFYSGAAARLESIEGQSANRARRRLRRIGGCFMLALGALFFAGFHAVDAQAAPRAFVAVWLSIFALLLAIVILAIIDMRLTRKMRERRREP